MQLGITYLGFPSSAVNCAISLRTRRKHTTLIGQSPFLKTRMVFETLKNVGIPFSRMDNAEIFGQTTQGGDNRRPFFFVSFQELQHFTNPGATRKKTHHEGPQQTQPICWAPTITQSPLLDIWHRAVPWPCVDFLLFFEVLLGEGAMLVMQWKSGLGSMGVPLHPRHLNEVEQNSIPFGGK